MRKLLYITDQQEYSENGTISTLFDIYLKKYWDVHIVYVTKYKHSFQEKGTHFIVPIDQRSNVLEYLESKNINISEYSFVFVRNKTKVLQNVLNNKERYSYKVAFRVSYPIKHHRLEYINTFFPYSLIKKLQYKNKIEVRDTLLNQCDLFLPSSKEANDAFYSNITTQSFPIYTGLDPDLLNEHIVSSSDITKFIYVGSIDAIREFNVILDAFFKLNNDDWHLTISTTKKAYIIDLLKNYPQLKKNITLQSAMSLEELRVQINQNDIGIALMPRNQFYDTVIPDKVMDYYSCSLPTLLTSNTKNHSIFDSNEAFFCDFTVESIAIKLQELINSPGTQDAIVGNKGQEKLLALKRNYKILAASLASKLDTIIED
jgi:hypothetical protein